MIPVLIVFGTGILVGAVGVMLVTLVFRRRTKKPPAMPIWARYRSLPWTT